VLRVFFEQIGNVLRQVEVPVGGHDRRILLAEDAGLAVREVGAVLADVAMQGPVGVLSRGLGLEHLHLAFLVVQGDDHGPTPWSTPPA
jgi:hypothetical protein